MKVFIFYEREIWWISVGVNIGTEIDGKNKKFERPVLVFRKINKDQFFGIPIVSNSKKYKNCIAINLNNKLVYVNLSQLRVFSSKRLIRKIEVLEDNYFLDLKIKFINFISYESK